MHGCGNDYVFVDGPDLPSAETVRAVCDRRRGVGADGVIVLTPTGGAVAMTVFNTDGTDGGMCGNGARCAAQLAVRRGWVPGPVVRLLAGSRVVEAEVLDGSDVRAVMGVPGLDLTEIPVDASRLDESDEKGVEHRVGGLPAVFVSMGNPHLVSFGEADVWGLDLAAIGARMETHAAFPQRMNVHLARVVDRAGVDVRSWERGAGATAACGTGACAVVVAGVLTGRLDRDVRVRMPGGMLRATWDEGSGAVLLTGPTATVYEGRWVGGSG